MSPAQTAARLLEDDDFDPKEFVMQHGELPFILEKHGGYIEVVSRHSGWLGELKYVDGRWWTTAHMVSMAIALQTEDKFFDTPNEGAWYLWGLWTSKGLR